MTKNAMEQLLVLEMVNAGARDVCACVRACLRLIVGDLGEKSSRLPPSVTLLGYVGMQVW